MLMLCLALELHGVMIHRQLVVKAQVEIRSRGVDTINHHRR